MSAPLQGKVTPPDDLQPAIDALGPIGLAYLISMTTHGREVTPLILAKAADYERGELK